jgi:hypothetical protein
MKILEGLGVDKSEERGEWVVRLLKAIYGLKQAGRMWAKQLCEVLTSLDSIHTECKHSFYVYKQNGTKVFVPVYVDDLTITVRNGKRETYHSRFNITGLNCYSTRPNPFVYLSQSVMCLVWSLNESLLSLLSTISHLKYLMF